MIKLKSILKQVIGISVCILALSYAVMGQAKVALTDPEIASVAVTANQIDVSYGNIALKKSKNTDIRKFAQTMITDHSGVIAQATALVKKLGVTPKTNAVTKQLLQGAASTEKKLNAAKRSDFDNEYINNEVAYHESVISAVNNLLIPQAQNQELKALLVKVAPVLQEHLDHAKMIQAALKKASN